MKTKIYVTVGIHPDTKQHIARVVKATFDATTDRVLDKRALSQTGRWLKLLPGSVYPDNTAFEVTVREFADEHKTGS